jgi:DNA-binding transcriptional regulator YiaG
VSTGTLSKWERGEFKPRGPNGRLHIIKHESINAAF